MPRPSVCIVLPCLNEVGHIDVCLQSLTDQTFQGPIEIIVADGGSADGTIERLAEWTVRQPNIQVINNPARLQSAGIWTAAQNTDAEILVRADAHTVYAADYVDRSIESLMTSDAVAVGGKLHPVGSSAFGMAVSAAMQHPLGVGPAGFHTQTAAGFVDTVYLGTFRRADFLGIGGMRTLPAGVAEDADMYYRWRRNGRKVLLDPAIRSEYTPRDRPRTLWNQFFRYGVGKADMLIINGEFPSWRPLAPLALVLGLAAGTLILPWTPWLLILVGGVWSLVLIIGMRFRLQVVLAAGIMHLAFGLGLLRGLLRRPSTVRAMVVENAQPE